MSALLPLFVLDVVLFPGAPLPLHVFEPRYRRLLADCLEGDRRFGIAPPAEPGEVPEPGAVGCVAEVRAVQPRPDGRADIVVVGVERFTVRSVREASSETPYATAVVDVFEDDAGTEPRAEDAERLSALLTRCVSALHELAESEDDAGFADVPDDATALSFRAAALLPGDAAPKRRMLEMRSTAERTALLLRILPPLAEQTESAAAVHRGARHNGRGHHRSDFGPAR